MTGIRRWAQERHTHVNPPTKDPDTISGMYSALTTSGSSNTMDKCIGLTLLSQGANGTGGYAADPGGPHLKQVRRMSRKTAGGANNHAWIGGGAPFANTKRGFWTRLVFGTHDRGTALLFGGIANTTPAVVPITDFASWASTYALGICVQPNTDKVLWAWRVNPTTVGTAPTGLSWDNLDRYTLTLSCEAAASKVTARLWAAGVGGINYVFTEVPDANRNAAALMGPLILHGGQAVGTPEIAVVRFEAVEPW